MSPAGQTTTLAGNGSTGSINGDALASTFNGPTGIVIDAAAARLFVADTGNKLLRVVAGGAVTTLAGGGTVNADGRGATAGFASPRGVALFEPTGVLYGACAAEQFGRKESLISCYTPTPPTNPSPLPSVSDTGINRLRAVAIDTGEVTTIAGSGLAAFADGVNAAFAAQFGIAVDATGNLFVADTKNNAIRRWSLSTRATVTVAGSGAVAGSTDGAAAARFFEPQGIAVDESGTLYGALLRRVDRGDPRDACAS